MARGNYRVSGKQCLHCGFTDPEGKPMPYKYGRGANKAFICEKCFSKSGMSKESDISKYKHKTK